MDANLSVPAPSLSNKVSLPHFPVVDHAFEIRFLGPVAQDDAFTFR